MTPLVSDIGASMHHLYDKHYKGRTKTVISTDAILLLTYKNKNTCDLFGNIALEASGLPRGEERNSIASPSETRSHSIEEQKYDVQIRTGKEMVEGSAKASHSVKISTEKY